METLRSNVHVEQINIGIMQILDAIKYKTVLQATSFPPILVDVYWNVIRLQMLFQMVHKESKVAYVGQASFGKMVHVDLTVKISPLLVPVIAVISTVTVN